MAAEAGPSPVTTAARYLELASAARLVPEPVLNLLRNSRTFAAADLAESEKIARIGSALIAKRRLTAWQHRQLLLGKHRGFHLDGWKILEPLARGGMSRVYLAEHVRLNKLAAVKVLSADRVLDDLYLAYFREEIRLLGQLSHPHVVHIYDAGLTEGVCYLAMQLLQGSDLHSYVQKHGPLSESEIARCLLQTAEALEYVHRRGVVHRDVKPSNLWLEESGTIRLIDFGLACPLGPAETTLRLPSRGAVGTADFIPPEQASRCDDVDQRADLYGLGATLYYLLTARPPFPVGTALERMERHCRDEPEPITALRPGVDPFFVALCKRLMAKRAADRLPSARTVRLLVESWLRGNSVEEKLATWENTGFSGIWRSGAA